MDLVLSKKELVNFIADDSDNFYTDDELALLAKIRSGEIKTSSHDDVMARVETYIDELFGKK